MKFVKKLLLAAILAMPLQLMAITPCTCYSSEWTSGGWISYTWHYATNNGSCILTGSNTYNFGSVDIYFGGDYIGSVDYGMGRSNINDYLTCYQA